MTQLSDHLDGVDLLGAFQVIHIHEPAGWDWEVKQNFLTAQEFVLVFKKGRITLAANCSDDTIIVAKSSQIPLEKMIAMSEHEPWIDLIGSEIIWYWRLTNNLGFQDGVQFEFRKADVYTTVQFIAIASNVRAAWLTRRKPQIVQENFLSSTTGSGDT